jgi:hypothetical protein
MKVGGVEVKLQSFHEKKMTREPKQVLETEDMGAFRKYNGGKQGPAPQKPCEASKDGREGSPGRLSLCRQRLRRRRQ